MEKRAVGSRETAFQIRTESDGMRLKHQRRWSPHALSNSADATSIVSFGQAIASSSGFVGTNDPTNPPMIIHRGEQSTPQ
jgi:hypothetical protein